MGQSGRGWVLSLGFFPARARGLDEVWIGGTGAAWRELRCGWWRGSQGPGWHHPWWWARHLAGWEGTLRVASSQGARAWAAKLQTLVTGHRGVSTLVPVILRHQGIHLCPHIPPMLLPHPIASTAPQILVAPTPAFTKREKGPGKGAGQGPSQSTWLSTGPRNVHGGQPDAPERWAGQRPQPTSAPSRHTPSIPSEFPQKGSEGREGRGSSQSSV